MLINLKLLHLYCDLMYKIIFLFNRPWENDCSGKKKKKGEWWWGRVGAGEMKKMNIKKRKKYQR